MEAVRQRGTDQEQEHRDAKYNRSLRFRGSFLISGWQKCVKDDWFCIFHAQPHLLKSTRDKENQQRSICCQLEGRNRGRFISLNSATLTISGSHLFVAWSQFSKAQNHTAVSHQHQPWWTMLFSDLVLLFGWTWVRSSHPHTPAGLVSHHLCSQLNTALLRSTYCLPSNAFKN